MANVDPFVIPIPDQFKRDQNTHAYMLYLTKFLHDLWIRTGGGDDQIANQQLRELYPWVVASQSSEVRLPEFHIPQKSESLPQFSIAQQFTQLPTFQTGQKRPEFISVSANHTTAGDEIVEVTSNVTISLNASPDAEETVTIKRNTTAGAVTVSGNGKNIDGAATYSLVVNYESITALYSASSGQWIIV